MSSVIKKFILLSLISFLQISTYADEDESELNVFRHNSMDGWSVNSYWIETEKGIVLIDSQFLIKDAKNLAALLKTKNKPIAGLIITHSHPDHFGGIDTLQSILGKFPVYATKATNDGLQQAHDNFQRGFASTFNGQAYKKLIKADHLLESGKTINFAGVELHIDDLGPGEASDNIVIWHKPSKTLFTGDATMNGHHFWVGEGRSKAVLKSLNYLKETYKDAKRLLTGHGDPEGLYVIDNHIEYVETIRDMTLKAMAENSNLDENKRLKPEARANLTESILLKYPSLGRFGIPSGQVVTWNTYGLEAEYKQ